MNKLCAILIISILAFLKVNAQKQITTWDGEIYRNMSITLKNGSVIQGYGKVVLIDFEDIVSFKRTKEEGELLYGFEDIVYLKTKIGKTESIFKYRTLIASPGDEEWSKLTEVILDGKLMLYQGYYDLTSTDAKRLYYLSKKDDATIISVKLGDTSQRSIQGKICGYVKDCPDLYKKIKSKYFKRYGIKDMVNYYNNNCFHKKK